MKAKKIVIALAALVLSGVIQAGTITTIVPDSTTWTDARQLPGAKVAVLMGNPAKKGPFIAWIKLPPNFIVPVHSHPGNEYDTVISGTLYLGAGDEMNIEKVTALPAGTFLAIPAKTNHYVLTKGETILQITGTGPWGMIYKKKSS